MNREELVATAQALHDEEGCRCDPRYIMSCPRMAQAILRAGRRHND